MSFRKITILIAYTAVTAWASACAAEALQMLQIEFSPMIETSKGEIDMCGLHFSVAGMSTGGRAFGIQGTVYNSYFTGKMPGVLLKVSAVEAVNGSPARLNVRNAYLFDNDHITTSTFKQLLPPDDPASFMAMGLLSDNPDAFTSLQDQMLAGQVWLSVNFGDTTGDYTAQLTPDSKSGKVFEQLLRCNAKGSEKMQRELTTSP